MRRREKRVIREVQGTGGGGAGEMERVSQQMMKAQRKIKME